MTDHAVPETPPGPVLRAARWSRATAWSLVTAAARKEVARKRAEYMTSALDRVQGEIGRADSKADTLLTFAGGSFALLGTFAASTTTRIPLSATIMLGVATGFAVAALILALRVVRPKLNGARRGDVFPTQEGLLNGGPADLSCHQENELRVLNEMAVSKYRLVRRAVDLLTCAVAAAVVAVILTVVL